MKHSNFSTILCAAVLVFVTVSCNLFAASKTEEVKSGRLKYVETLKYGAVGTHGSQGWYVDDRNFYVNGKKWSPEKMDVKDAMAGCEADPNESIEALKCTSFDNGNETIYLLQMKADKPDWAILYQEHYTEGRGKSSGEWLNDGKTVIFKDYYYHILTGEKQEINGLPDYPENYFRAASPDLETVVYQGSYFNGFIDAAGEVERNRQKISGESERLNKNKLEVLWIIEAKTGATKFVELSRDKYDWLIWENTKFATRADWLKFYQSQISWEKDKDGKYQFIAPK
jgi:hypothetical protein